jgi:hypothetical protein
MDREHCARLYPPALAPVAAGGLQTRVRFGGRKTQMDREHSARPFYNHRPTLQRA